MDKASHFPRAQVHILIHFHLSGGVSRERYVNLIVTIGQSGKLSRGSWAGRENEHKASSITRCLANELRLISTATSPSVHVSVCRGAINSHWCRWWAASSNGFLLVYIAESVPVWITRHPHRVINSYAAFDSNCTAQPPTGRLCLPVCFSTQHQVLIAQWRDRRTGRPQLSGAYVWVFCSAEQLSPQFLLKAGVGKCYKPVPFFFLSSSSSGDFRRN